VEEPEMYHAVVICGGDVTVALGVEVTVKGFRGNSSLTAVEIRVGGGGGPATGWR
jgi:hypothetical protein